jgi:formate dehydrogenase (NADP+) beta subunit
MIMRSAARRHARPQRPDAAWYLETVSCRAACPVGTDAAGYVQAIARGEYDHAYDLARAHNPFPSICARVCSAPCERACRRGVIDAPIAIRALKRVVCEMVGAEAATAHDSTVPAATRWHEGHGAIPRATGPSIGIIGGGPAGLAAAHELRLAGHPVTIYEAGVEAGGMLVAGIPSFRLPRDVIRAEITAILSMGMTLVTGCTIGRDRALDELLRDHAALLITVGCGRGRMLPIPGASLNGVVLAIDALQAINAGRLSTLRAPIVVIGGGSVAFDAARTARRTAAWGDMHTALDAARSAVRSTSTPVTLIAPESREALTVPGEELHEADQEGVTVRSGYGVRAIVGTDRVEGVTIAPIVSLYDAAGRFQPVLADGRDETLRAATVVLAVGQQSDTSFLDAALGLEPTSWRGVRADADGRTAHARVYAAGDVATGPRDLIDAIAAGQRAAWAIHEDLTSADPKHGGHDDRTDPHHGEAVLRVPVEMPYRAWTGYDTVGRRDLPVLRVADRQVHDEVEQLLGEMDARREAARCLQCDVHIELDAGRCVACGLCVDVCPYGCIALTPEEASVEGSSPHGPAILALSLDEAACVRCGLCVDRCPPDALSFARVVVHV